jgi:hypothetical protein
MSNVTITFVISITSAADSFLSTANHGDTEGTEGLIFDYFCVGMIMYQSS